MAVGGKVEGAIAFGCLRRARDWPDALVERIRALADVFANALAHKRAQEALDAAIEFERTVSGVLGRAGHRLARAIGPRDRGGPRATWRACSAPSAPRCGGASTSKAEFTRRTGG